MGSEKYPYKGIIDHFANRGFSNGTNAWTDTDHTAYTVSTAGEAGKLIRIGRLGMHGYPSNYYS